ncbi:MAG: DegT/DnrJ/EryC1/StrS family aminotransferase [Armatimonadota bacterium]
MTIDHVEQLIARHFDRTHCILAGSGSTAIYLLLHALHTKRRAVLMPSILCPAPLYAVIGAGFSPIFADVEHDSYLLSPTDVEARTTAEAGVLLAPHLFGTLLPREQISSVARRHGLFLVEDAAQGAWWKPPVPGSATVISFGWHKPMSAGWGGAVLTDDEALAEELRRLRNALKAPDITPRRADVEAVPSPEVWLRPLVPAQLHRIVGALASWREHIERRRHLSQLYARLLRHPGVVLPPQIDIPLWRFTVLLPNGAIRNRVLTGLCRRGLSAWRMYPPLHLRWPNLAPRLAQLPLTASEDVGRRTLNLVIDPNMANEDAVAHAVALTALLKEVA